MIIAGFPGVGKTEFYNTLKKIRRGRNAVFSILDSDSSQFSWLDQKNKIRNPDFPKNYISHIKEKYPVTDIILTSTHDVVLMGLVKEGYEDLYIVCPDRKDKEIYRQRYINRGSPMEFINLLMDNWDSFIDDVEATPGAHIIYLKHGDYLSSLIGIDITDRSNPKFFFNYGKDFEEE